MTGIQFIFFKIKEILTDGHFINVCIWPCTKGNQLGMQLHVIHLISNKLLSKTFFAARSIFLSVSWGQYIELSKTWNIHPGPALPFKSKVWKKEENLKAITVIENALDFFGYLFSCKFISNVFDCNLFPNTTAFTIAVVVIKCFLNHLEIVFEFPFRTPFSF